MSEVNSEFEPGSIYTGGGAAIKGYINTEGGDFINGDKIIVLNHVLIDHTLYSASLPIKPDPFVRRQSLYDRLHSLFCNSEAVQGEQKRVAVLLGGPGFGKTTLAWDFHESLQIKQAYPDGVFWITIGQKIEHRDAGLQHIVAELSRTPNLYHQLQDPVLTIANLLINKKCLIILARLCTNFVRYQVNKRRNRGLLK